jgi:hypothetical protein
MGTILSAGLYWMFGSKVKITKVPSRMVKVVAV